MECAHELRRRHRRRGGRSWAARRAVLGRFPAAGHPKAVFPSRREVRPAASPAAPKTSELRRPDDPFDASRRKGDLTATGLFDSGATILDVGITHPTIDSSVSSLSSEVRAAGANAYAAAKDRRANAIIEEKGLDIGFKAITFGTYGAFGKASHKLIATATANSPLPVYSPWVRPGPKAHAYLLFGFTLARANARMLINAGSKRSSARNAVRTSRSRSTSQVAVHE